MRFFERFEWSANVAPYKKPNAFVTSSAKLWKAAASGTDSIRAGGTIRSVWQILRCECEPGWIHGPFYAEIPFASGIGRVQFQKAARP